MRAIIALAFFGLCTAAPLHRHQEDLDIHAIATPAAPDLRLRHGTEPATPPSGSGQLGPGGDSPGEALQLRQEPAPQPTPEPAPQPQPGQPTPSPGAPGNVQRITFAQRGLPIPPVGGPPYLGGGSPYPGGGSPYPGGGVPGYGARKHSELKPQLNLHDSQGYTAPPLPPQPIQPYPIGGPPVPVPVPILRDPAAGGEP
ncbi:hypothetical protein EKO27_g741 [Xylaria grammica]|uniref:Uncharacterized protein n=1 Tax=Xylaria grammica TaxID=363999 RepID=A0A439DJ04_9PEZI|nr:hypothetical protein EKO27_g741 [Xylaria grammica]